MKHGFLADLAQARGTQNDGFVPMRLARGVTWFAPDASPEDRQVVRSLIHRTEWQAGGLQLPPRCSAGPSGRATNGLSHLP